MTQAQKIEQFDRTVAERDRLLVFLFDSGTTNSLPKSDCEAKYSEKDIRLQAHAYRTTSGSGGYVVISERLNGHWEPHLRALDSWLYWVKQLASTDCNNALRILAERLELAVNKHRDLLARQGD